VVCATASASNFSVSGAGGPIPASGTGGGGTYQTSLPPTPFVSSVCVVYPVTTLSSVQLFGIQHTWVGDLQIVLRDPAGQGYNLMVRPGFTGAGFGSSGDFLSPGQNISFVPSGATIPDTGNQNINSGSYSQHYGFTASWNNGNLGIY